MDTKHSSRFALAIAAATLGGIIWGALLGGAAAPVPLYGQDDPTRVERHLMVDRQIRARGVNSARVLAAMRRVPRHVFVPADLEHMAYADTPLPIGHEQTISQPYIVAYMTESLRLPPDAKVLDIGTGSGYQAAVLAEVARTVYSIEIVPELAASATERLRSLGYTNIRIRHGDGYQGWPEHAPFDGIIVAAAPNHIPPALVEQLAIGARLVIPVGDRSQTMTIVTKTETGSTVEATFPVRFVPMTGGAVRQPGAPAPNR